MNSLKVLLYFAILITVLRSFRKRYRRGLRLPPGPKGIPILGNIFDVQTKREESILKTYANWSQKYGDVFTFEAPARSF
ncbi:hypothetical protein L218DRAFT_960908 [Marasmius fiardii PR-910]|nr:hypothetical protein L218DRAFT_960908 [Marasmius fiardii PR-910]